mmetsp:Transcript_113346/g.351983  ORF Transcript_113346/g.351983 Transcript_113346/m.351983 type:complete len:153 (+) Transcript_113346:892-1350(+)
MSKQCAEAKQTVAQCLQKAKQMDTEDGCKLQHRIANRFKAGESITPASECDIFRRKVQKQAADLRASMWALSVFDGLPCKKKVVKQKTQTPSTGKVATNQNNLKKAKLLQQLLEDDVMWGKTEFKKIEGDSIVVSAAPSAQERDFCSVCDFQ